MNYRDPDSNINYKITSREEVNNSGTLEILNLNTNIEYIFNSEDLEMIFIITESIEAGFLKIIEEESQNEIILILGRDDGGISLTAKRKTQNLSLGEFTFKRIKKFGRHRRALRKVVLLSDGRIAASGDDQILIIFNKDTFEAEIEIEDQEIRNFEQISNDLICTSNAHDSIIKIIKFTEGISVIKRISEGDEIRRNQIFKLSNDTFITTGDFIKKYSSLEPFALIKKEEIAFVHNIFELSNGYLITTSDDNKLIFWNPNTLEKVSQTENINTSYGHYYGANGFLEIDEKWFIIGGVDKIYLFNSNTFELTSVINDSRINFACAFCLLRDESILCGNFQGQIFLFNYKDGINYSFSELKQLSYNGISGLIPLADNKMIYFSPEVDIYYLEY